MPRTRAEVEAEKSKLEDELKGMQDPEKAIADPVVPPPTKKGGPASEGLIHSMSEDTAHALIERIAKLQAKLDGTSHEDALKPEAEKKKKSGGILDAIFGDD